MRTWNTSSPCGPQRGDPLPLDLWDFLAAMTEGQHLFPFRTQQLSLLVLMVPGLRTRESKWPPDSPILLAPAH